MASQPVYYNTRLISLQNLVSACESGHLESVEILLGDGVNPNQREEVRMRDVDCGNN